MNTPISRNSNTKIIIGGLVVLLLAAAAYGFATMPDRRSPMEKVGDAVGQLDSGVDDAARELESRTPAERAADGIKDATDGSPE